MTGTYSPDEDGPAPDDEGPRRVGFFARRRRPQSPTEALQPEDAPPPPDIPPSQRRPALSAISGFLSFLLVAAVCGLVGLGFAHQRLGAPGPLAADRVLVIAPRTELPEIVAQLEREGVIDSPLLFNVGLLMQGNRGNVKSGEYLFRQNASLQDVMDTLVSGKQVLHSLTIPEGLTSEQIVARLRDDDVLAGEVRDVPKEGTLLPETYKFERGFSRAALLRKMQDAQRKVLEQVWGHRSPDLSLHSPAELVTLASVVEKETGKADERPRVARVFLNRLAKRMRLQSDPTIVYGIVGGRGTLGRPITKAEILAPTPYNTYQVDGLPPGPIANPGRAALEAVANASRTNDLYFVADGTGGHVFAETLDAHNRNVQRWRQIEKDRAAATPAPDVDRVQPQDVPASNSGGGVGLKGDQRGELPPVRQYGALPRPFGVPATATAIDLRRPLRTPGGVFAQRDRMMPVLGYAETTRPRDKRDRREKFAAPIALAAPLVPITTALGPASSGPISFAGLEMSVADLGLAVATPKKGPAALDGAEDPNEPDAPPVETIAVPMSAGMRAEIRAKEAKYGLAQTSDELPADAGGAARRPGTKVAGATPSLPPVDGRPRILDASEGTPLDPLLEKGWDLNSPQKVPVGLR